MNKVKVTKIEKGDVVKYKLPDEAKSNLGFVMDTYDLGEFRTETDGVIHESFVTKVYKDKDEFGKTLSELYYKSWHFSNCGDTGETRYLLLKTMKEYKDYLVEINKKSKKSNNSK
jgi:hypothetical protein